ncbi:pyroglutamyl-peptidase I [Bdellovibrio sp. NC01]|uniref:pyroglutamyl-peptidase I n=1 Tax=Bdellovibrio sp. NC01 TaxID=2220073 RepID=UPI0011594481|nr:pyroglutamyl-peptidase I [Bdellovibrio sp. NC01]QDK36806.1 pyroglutamyl-peptidase I [Bdellovibrio sp. NC01]
MSRKILLTGFKPFNKEPINPAEILTTNLAGKFANVTPLVLPVSYERSFEELKNFWHNEGPFDALLMLGQAGGRQAVCLERVALNWSETSLPDEDGNKLAPQKLIEEAPTSYISDFFNQDWITDLNKIGPTTTSFSAGTYVCNSLYFKSLHHITQAKIPTLFVHVPYLPEQVQEKPNTASMKLETQQNIIEKLITLITELKT